MNPESESETCLDCEPDVEALKQEYRLLGSKALSDANRSNIETQRDKLQAKINAHRREVGHKAKEAL